MKNNLLKVLVFLSSVFLSVSCEIGLGEAVDASAPTLEISYPKAGSVIMEDFILSGKCSDDKGIERIEVTLTELVNGSEGTNIYGPYEAEFTDDSWQLVLNKPEFLEDAVFYPVRDGTYRATVTAIDTAKRREVKTTTFEIDNTAPFFLLANPLYRGSSENVSEFGRTFSIAGDVADDHKVTSMTFSAYPYDEVSGKLGDKISIDVSGFNTMSHQNPLVIANYYTEEDAGTDVTRINARKNYLKLYPDADNEAARRDITYYCNLELRDNARVFKNSEIPGGEEKGNATTYYYLNELELYRKLMGTNSVYHFTAENIKDFLIGKNQDLNGNSKYTSEEINEIQQALEKVKVLGKEVSIEDSVKFILNPDNSPVWNISGGYTINPGEEGKDPEGYKSYSSLETMTINIKSGKDNIPIMADSLKVTFIPNDGSSSEIIPVEEGSVRTLKTPTYHVISISFKDCPSVQIGKRYKVVLSGHDKEGNSFVAKGGSYGFFIKSSKSSPSLKISTPSDNYYSWEALKSGLTVKGTVKYDDGASPAEDFPVKATLNSFEDKMNVAPGFDCNGEKFFECTSYEKMTRSGDVYNFTVTIKDINGKLVPQEKGTFLYVADITVLDNLNNFTKTSFKFYVDNKGPEITDSYVTPVISKNGKNYINGKPTLSLDFKDNYKFEGADVYVYYGTVPQGSPSGTPYKHITDEKTQVEIDTTAHGKDTSETATVYIVASDKVGNKTTKELSFLVDQKTDAPEIVFTNGEDSITNRASLISQKANIFEKKGTVKGTVSDDDRIGTLKVTARLSHEDGTFGSEIVLGQKTGVEGKTLSLEDSFVLPEDCGIYEITVKVNDGILSTGIASKVFYVAVDDGNPVLKITSTVPSYKKSGDSVSVPGTVSDGNKVSLKRIVKNRNGSENPVDVSVAPNGNWTDSFAVIGSDNDAVSVVYKATDIFGNATEISKDLKIDQKAPVLDSSSPAVKASENNKWFTTDSPSFELWFREEGSGMTSKAFYWVNEEDLSLPESGSFVAGLDQSSGLYVYTLNLKNLKQGNNKVIFRTVDDVGNVNDSNVLEFQIDSIIPSITETLHESAVKTNGTKDIVLKGNIIEETSGVSDLSFVFGDKDSADSSVTITKTKSDYGQVVLSKKSEIEWEWTLTIDCADENGEKKTWFSKIPQVTSVYATISDNAGNTGSKVHVMQVASDVVPPQVKISGIDVTVPRENKVYINGTINLDVEAQDETELAEVRLMYALNGSSNWTPFTSVTNGKVDTSDSTSWKVSFDTKEFSDGTSVKFKALAKDAAGNDSSYELPTIYFIDQDTDKPSVQFTNISEVFDQNSAIVSGLVQDDDAIKSIVVFYKLKSEENYSSSETLYNNPDSEQVYYSFSFKNLPKADNKYVYGIYDVKVAVTDINNISTEAEKTFFVDDGKPSLNILVATAPFKENDSELVSAKFIKSTEQVVNKGKASDANGVVLTRSYRIGSGNLLGEIEIPVSESGDWKDIFKLSDVEKIAGEGKLISFVYKATDPAGNVTVIDNVSYTVDTEKPVYNGELYIENKALSLTSTIGKDTISISGNFTETVSSVSEIRWWIQNLRPVESDPVLGSCGASLVSGNYHFNSIVSGFAEGRNVLWIQAEDQAGNKSDLSSFEIRIDQHSPEFTCNQSAQTFISNGSESITLTGTVSDSSSGVKTVVLSLSEKDYPATVYENGTWTCTLPASELVKLHSGTSYSVSATASDNAGNTTYINRATGILCDTDKPSVSFTNNAEVENGVVTLRGTSKDSNLFSTTLSFWVSNDKINWSQDTITHSETFVAQEGETVQEWEKNIDTVLYNSYKYLKIVASAIDSASGTANTGTAEYAFEIDQNEDRPVISFQPGSISITSDGINKSRKLLKNRALTATIVDDDGEIKGFWFTTDKKVAQETKPSVGNPAPAGWKAINIDNSTWTVNIEGEGDIDWYFYIVDSKNKAFESINSSALNRPFISDEHKAKQDVAGAVEFCIDSVPPSVQNLKLARKPKGTVLPASSISDSDFNITENGTIFGASESVLYAMVTVKEVTGLKADNPVYIQAGNHIIENKYFLVSHESGSDEYIYKLGPVDFSSFESAVTSFAVVAKDNADGDGQASLSIFVDNTEPTVSMNYPKKTHRITSTVTAEGIVVDNAGGSGVESFAYYIPLKADVKPQETNRWISVINNGEKVTWSIDFDSEDSGSLKSLSHYVDTSVYKTENPDTGVYRIPLWFRVTDKLGNIGYNTENYIEYDTEGGKPSVEIITPVNGSTVGGIVQISGTSYDDVKVDEVHLQLDVNDDGVYDARDYDILNSDIWNGTDIQTSLKGDASSWYLLAQGTESWHLRLPASLIGSDSDVYIRIRASAFDEQKNTRGWSDAASVCRIRIDKDSPVFDRTEIVQYKDSDTSFENKIRVIDATKLVSLNEPASGYSWYLETVVSDNEHIASYEVVVDESSYNKKVLELSKVENDIKKGKVPSQLIRTKLNLSTGFNGSSPAEEGTVKALVKVCDNVSGSATQSISIVYDSKAPSLYDKNGNPQFLSSNLEDKLRLVFNNTENTVMNSNYAFSISDSIYETGSGLDFIALYIQRKNTVYNLKNGVKNEIGSSITLNEEHLPVLKVSGTRSSENSFTSSTSISSNTNITRGTLVKIGGTYQIITSKSGDTVTFDKAVSTDVKSCEFVYSVIINNPLEETKPKGSLDIVNDDGDGILDFVSSLGGARYSWKTEFDSSVIPDGPVQIVVTAFDKAGNYVTGTLNSKVTNNAPRIAKVLVATDLNGDGKYKYAGSKLSPVETEDFQKIRQEREGAIAGEFSVYSAIDQVTRDYSKNAVLTPGADKYFTVKNGLLVMPEFIGGNHSSTDGKAMKFTWKSNNSVDSTELLTDQSPVGLAEMKSRSELKSEELITQDSTDFDIYDQVDGNFGAAFLSKSQISAYTTESSVTKGSLSTDYRYFSYTFWDETEETEQGKDAQFTTLVLPVIVDQTDNIAPDAVIKPFHWTSLTDNGAYGCQNAKKQGDLLGHVEYTDIPGKGWLASTSYEGTSGQFDADPKVSGAIRIQGTAFDESMVKSISLKAEGFDLGSGLSEYAVLATFDGTTWTTVNKTVEENGYAFIVRDVDGVTQNGHSVEWELDLDTSLIEDSDGKRIYVKADVTVSAKVSDGVNTSYESTYRMDIVPYITKLQTVLSTRNEIYGRSSDGHYSVNGGRWSLSGVDYSATSTSFNGTKSTAIEAGSGETIKVVGYNINPSSEETSLVYDYVSELASGSSTGNAAAYTVNSDGTVSVPMEGEYSGKITLTVSGLTTLNNLNDNNSDSNLQPNGTNNKIQNDDVICDVWEFNTLAQHTAQEYQYPTVKMNPVTGQLGLSATDSVYGYIPAIDSKKKIASNIPFGSTHRGASFNTFSYDENGNSYGEVFFQPSNGTNEGGGSAIFLLGRQEFFDKIGRYGYVNSRGGVRLESVVNTIGTDDRRVQSFNIVVKDDPKEDAERKMKQDKMVHVAYYDNLTNSIRYRRGPIWAEKYFSEGSDAAGAMTFACSTETPTISSISESNIKRNVSNMEFKNPSALHDINDAFGKIRSGVSGDHTAKTDRALIDSLITPHAQTVHIVASAGLIATNVKTNMTIYYVENYTKNNAAFGYCGLGVNDTGDVGIAWYDGTGLNYAYMTEDKLVAFEENLPDTSTENEKYEKSLERTRAWESHTETVSASGGQYVQMQVDEAGGVHIVFFDNGKLKYGYKESITSGNWTINTIDGSVASGNCTLFVGNDNGVRKVYVAYQGKTMAKMAVRTVGTSSDGYSSANKSYTGAWKISMVPTKETINNQDYNVNVAIRQNGDAVNTMPSVSDNQGLVYQVKYSSPNLTPSHSSVAYGNGSSYPVISYATQSGDIEMAQIR